MQEKKKKIKWSSQFYGNKKLDWQNSTHFHDKNTKTKVGIEGNFSTWKKIYEKSIGNIIFVDERLKDFLLLSRKNKTIISTLATSTEPCTEVPCQGN